MCKWFNTKMHVDVEVAYGPISLKAVQLRQIWNTGSLQTLPLSETICLGPK